MNVISRIIGALVATLLSWLGAKLGVEFSPDDHQTVTIAATGALVALYGILHPLIRSHLVRWTGRGGRTSTGAGQVHP